MQTHAVAGTVVLVLAAGCSQQEAHSPDLYSTLIAAGGSQAALAAELQPTGPVGQVTVLSTDQAPLPESVFTAGAYITVSGPASFDIPLGQPGLLTFHDRITGQRMKTIEVPYPAYLPPAVAPNALSVAVPGALGDIYVNQVLTGIYRVNSLLGLAEQYTTGPVPDVPPCSVDASGDCSPSPACPEPPIPDAPPCSATMGLPALPNSLLLSNQGMLYVSDSFQGILWRVPPDTRQHELWFTDPQLLGNPYSPLPAGANGLAKGPDGKLYIANTTGGPTLGGAIYRLALEPTPVAADLELVVAFDPFTPPGAPFSLPQGPDGLRFDAQGNLWVTLAFSNAVARLTLEDGQVTNQQLFTHNPVEGIPFNQPSELHLDARSTYAYFGNHAITPPTPEHWALMRMSVGVRGAPLEKPWLGWDCAMHNCNIDPRTLDRKHLVQLVAEELWGL